MKTTAVHPRARGRTRTTEHTTLAQLLPRRDQIKTALRALVQELPPGAALPSITALRQQFQVSQHTVDRVIGDLRAEGLVETRHRSGIYVTQPGRTLTIGILSADNLLTVNSGFYGLLAMALHQCARTAGIRFRHYFFRSLQDTTSYDQLLADARAGELQGLIGLGTGGKHLASLSVPYVDSTDPQIHLDYLTLVRLAVEALVVRGRRRLALFSHDPNLQGGLPEAMQGEGTAFQAAVARAGATTCAAWMQPLRQRDRDSRFWGFDEFTALWQTEGEHPDGLVCVDDQATQGALFAAERLGVTSPGELLIASHANSIAPQPDPTQVIRVEFDTLAIAQGLLARLQARIAGTPPAEPPVLTIPPRVRPADHAAHDPCEVCHVPAANE